MCWVRARWPRRVPCLRLSRALRRISVEAGASLYMTLLTAFMGQADGYGPLFELAFGSPEITRERIAKAEQELESLQARLLGGRSRLREKSEVQRAVGKLLGRLNVRRYLDVQIEIEQEHQ